MREKIKYVIVGILCAFGIWFLYSTYNQIQTNRKNIQAIGNFLNRVNSAQTAPAKSPAQKPEKRDDTK